MWAKLHMIEQVMDLQSEIHLVLFEAYHLSHLDMIVLQRTNDGSIFSGSACGQLLEIKH